ncbi:hypothetical protein KW783_02510 [Candidatus Parcubacteria bacterium]|nr:hypothetical protein [Candidatus Parcubacteria bacterium]
MLRDKSLRQGLRTKETFAARTFTDIDTWEEFLERWADIDTVQEAIGLLHAGAIINPFHDELYHHIGDPEERIFRRLALEFLAKQSEALLVPPYPRFIQEFLKCHFDRWKHRPVSGYESENSLRPFTKQYIRALCLWGLGHLLGAGGMGEDVIPVIEEYLTDQKYDAQSAFFNLVDGCDVPDNFSESGKNEALANTALALHKLQFWIGDGISAKFEGYKREKKA